MTTRKALVQINGALQECPATDLLRQPVVYTDDAPTDNNMVWMEEVTHVGEGYIAMMGVGGVGTVYNEQVTLFARNASGAVYATVLERIS